MIAERFVAAQGLIHLLSGPTQITEFAARPPAVRPPAMSPATQLSDQSPDPLQHRRPVVVAGLTGPRSREPRGAGGGGKDLVRGIVGLPTVSTIGSRSRANRFGTLPAHAPEGSNCRRVVRFGHAMDGTTMLLGWLRRDFTMFALVKKLFCHHEWDISRSRRGAYVCRKCGKRVAAGAG